MEKENFRDEYVGELRITSLIEEGIIPGSI